jgi:hypothetical protein
MKYATNSFKHDILSKVKAMEHDAVSRNIRSLDTQATRSVEMDTGHQSEGNGAWCCNCRDLTAAMRLHQQNALPWSEAVAWVNLEME